MKNKSVPITRKQFVTLCQMLHKKQKDKIFNNLISKLSTEICTPKDISDSYDALKEINRYYANEILNGYTGEIEIQYITIIT